ncbi:MAG: NAD(P)H-binding protein, partial [Rhodospirillaceae bacterium]|nr:NAD(P)H-binding protein [Rhodospirillaceae bacterium]
MANVFIIGATGGVGRRLGRLLVQSGHRVIGLYRKPEQAADLTEDGMSPVEGDMIEMTPDQLADAARGADVIVFTAGAAGSGL